MPANDNPASRPPSCGYCRKRGAPCVKHGGERSGVYTPKKAKRLAEAGVVVAPPKPEPEFMQGHEKDQAEIESWRPTVKLPGTPEYAGASRDDVEARRTK